MKLEKGQGLIDYAFMLMFVVVAIYLIFWVLFPLLLIPIVWPWIVGTAFPFLSGVVAGVMIGDPGSIVIAIIIIVVLLFLFSRRN